MAEFLLYTTLTCDQSADLMLRIKKHMDLPDPIKVELVETVKESAPQCQSLWDAND